MFRSPLGLARIGLPALGLRAGLRPPGGAAGPYISLSSSSVSEDATIGTTIGALSVVNHPSGGSGWTFAETADPDNKFAVSGANLNTSATLDYETKTSHSVTISATKSGQTSPTPRTFVISVTNVLEVTLNALSLSSTSFVTGSPTSGTITGATTGSTITYGALPAGLTINGVARTWAWDGTGAVSTPSIALTETHPDANNSPRVSNVGVTISDGGALDPSLTPPTYELVDGPTDTPIRLDIDVGVASPSEYLELLITSDLARLTPTLNPAPVVIGTGDIVFSGLSAYVPSGPVYIWLRRWNAALSQYGNWPTLPIKWGDTTAPTLLSAAGVQSGNLANLSVSSNEGEGILRYAVLLAASAAPVAADFLNDATGGVATGSTSTPANGSNAFNGVVMPVGSPVVPTIGNSNITDVGIRLTIATTGGAGTLRWYISTSATPPSLANLIAGTGAVTYGNAAVSADGDTIVNVSGLSPSTTYYPYAAFIVAPTYKAHFFQTDLIPLNSNVASSSAFAMTFNSAVKSGTSFATAAAAGAPVWNPSDKSSQIGLTNSNRTATMGSGSGAFGVRAVTSRNGSIPRYAAVQIGAKPSGDIAICLANASAGLGTYPGGDANSVAYYSPGALYPAGNTPISGLTSFTTGDTIGICFWQDVNGIGRVCFIDKNGAAIGGDPALLGENGIGFAHTSFPMLHLQQTGQAATFVLGTPPAGFTAWEF